VIVPVFKTGGWQAILSPVGSTPTRFRHHLQGILLLLDRTADLRENVIGVRSDKADRSQDDHENHCRQDGIFCDILSAVFAPKELENVRYGVSMRRPASSSYEQDVTMQACPLAPDMSSFSPKMLANRQFQRQ
jgi:hypothetical protein